MKDAGCEKRSIWSIWVFHERCFVWLWLRICSSNKVLKVSFSFLGGKKPNSFNLHQWNEQTGRRWWAKVPGLKWWDVSVLVLKNVSVFVFDCVTAGMPRLQGLASSPLCYVCVCCTASSCLICKCSVFEKCVMSVRSLTIYSESKRSFFHSPPSSSLPLSSNINFKPRETTMIWSHFLFCGRSFMAAKPTGRPRNSETQPDRCGRETPPAAKQVIHPQGTDRDELHRHIKSLESNFFLCCSLLRNATHKNIPEKHGMTETNI